MSSNMEKELSSMMPSGLKTLLPYHTTKLKPKSGQIPLSEALVLLVKHAYLGWETRLVFKCQQCNKPQEYPKCSQGESLVECCYCNFVNIVEQVSLKIGIRVDNAGG